MLLYVQLKETNRFKKCNSNFLLAFSRCFRFWAYTLARENILMRSFLATGWQAVLLSSFLGTAMGHRLCYLVSPPWLYCSAGLETNQSFLRNTPSQVWTAFYFTECSRASCWYLLNVDQKFQKGRFELEQVLRTIVTRRWGSCVWKLANFYSFWSTLTKRPYIYYFLAEDLQSQIGWLKFNSFLFRNIALKL